jgi:hypothetical protein
VTDIIKGFLVIITAGALASCGIGGGSKPTTLQPENWYKVREKPPTYFPKGVSKNHPTEQSDGMWVTTGDAAGTLYFIPNRGVGTTTLVAEALTQVTPQQRKLQNRSEDSSLSPGIVKDAIGGTAVAITSVAAEVTRRAGSIGWNRKKNRD